jgi:hypothetical protein
VQKGGTAGQQKADFHFQMRARDQRILAAPILDRRERQCTGIHRPDRHNRVRRANDLDRWMQLEADTVDRTGVKRCECGGVERCDVGRMMGACVRGLESRHVREVSKVVRRCKGGNELRQFIAIACEHRRARRAFQHESACHRAEKFLAHDFLDNREAAFEHVHQARDHVVAVHGQASRRNDRAGRTDSDRDRLLTVEQSFGKG